MNRPRTATCVLLLLLFFAATSMLDVKSALALNVSVQWGHLSPAGDAINGEHGAENWICNEIYQDFVDAGNWAYSNAYWTYTTVGYVYEVLQWEQNPDNPVNFATNWWVGDFWTATGPDPFGHLGFYGDGGYDNNIYDNNVYLYANYYLVYIPPYYWIYEIPSKQYFDFIWTCANGGLYWKDSSGNWDNIVGITTPDTRPGPPNPPPGYPPTNTNTQYGFYDCPYSAVGMPLGWTGTTSMNTNGYWYPDPGSYCYVGWEVWSPWMVNPTGYNGMQYKWFPYYFYRYALGLVDGTHHTTRDSIDYATKKIFGEGTYFGNSILYYGNWTWCPYAGMEGWWYPRMRVFGNSNMVLP